MNFDIFRQSILNACQTASYANFEKLANDHPDLICQWNKLYHSRSGDTIAHIAAMSGCLDILKYCSKRFPAILKKENCDKKSSLHVAAQSEQLKCLEFLISCQIPIDHLKRGDWTPLMLACTKNNIEVIQALVENGADTNLTNKDGWNCLHIASRVGNENIIQYLLNKHPNLWNTKSKNGRTPLHTAAFHGCYKVVELLLEKGNYNADEVDSCGTTPLMDAASSNHISIMELLILKKKASPNDVDVLGRTVLHIAAETGSIEAIEFLVLHCQLDVNSRCYRGETPLHYAAKNSQLQAMKTLLACGADVLLTDFKGRKAEEVNG